MDDEDLEPRRVKPPKPALDDLSIAELEAYIADLEGEIVRVRADIDKKDSHRRSVEGLFKA
jgi:uncharacterized small protein (DUF1192 family)